MNRARATTYLRIVTHMREAYGLALVRAVDVCPRKVLRYQQCRRFARRTLEYRPCLCDEARQIGMNDHAHLWRDATGRKVWSTEPYDVDDEKIAELRALLTPHGLIVDPRPYSPYYPGHTTLILVRASGAV